MAKIDIYGQKSEILNRIMTILINVTAYSLLWDGKVVEKNWKKFFARLGVIFDAPSINTVPTRLNWGHFRKLSTKRWI